MNQVFGKSAFFKRGPKDHANPPGYLRPSPTQQIFPTEREQIGTVCPNCHLQGKGVQVLKQMQDLDPAVVSTWIETGRQK